MSFLSLQEAADQLGVHYMTAYRYVRTGRLDAEKHGALWQVHVDDLQSFIDAKDPDDNTAALTSLDDAWLRLFKRLIAGDEAGSWNIIEECLSSGMTPDVLYTRLLSPAMTEVGERWAAGKLDVADEHLATATSVRLIGRLGPRFTRPGRSRGTVIVAMVAGDNHGIPSSMLADLLRLNRFEVIDLGANTPSDSIVAAAQRIDPVVAIGLCSVTGNDPAALPAALRSLNDQGYDGRLFVGGAAVTPSVLDSFTPRPFHSQTSEDAIAFVEGLAGNGRTGDAFAPVAS